MVDVVDVSNAFFYLCFFLCFCKIYSFFSSHLKKMLSHNSRHKSLTPPHRPPLSSRNQSSGLALLIVEMQKNADQVEKDILRSEDLLALVSPSPAMIKVYIGIFYYFSSKDHPSPLTSYIPVCLPPSGRRKR